jgi:sensor histidine kinase YesM
LLLQPLVENAVRHGVSKSSAPVTVALRSSQKDAVLEIQVSDDGPGVSGEITGNGVGLTNTRARLQQLYGEQQSLTLDRRAGGGTIATVLLPYHSEQGGDA